MKFIRNARLRDRIVDILSKALLIAISALACLWMVSGAHAGQASITGITAQPQPDGSFAIDFTLSQKVDAKAVSVEFERNFIQLSLKGVSAYPARTESINQASLEKVFTYQYQPDLARARVLLKSAAAAIKDKASWELTPTGVRILVKGQAVAASDSLKTSAAAASTMSTLSSITAASSETEEDRLVQEILAEAKPGAAKTVSAAAPAVVAPNKQALSSSASEEQPLFSSKTAGADGADSKSKEAPATRIFASLLLVIGIIGASALAYRRFALGKGISFQKQPKVIDLISSQAIGPKRSIALVKVLDQYMVVGMAGEGMSLLANLGSDVKIEKYLDQSGPGASFTDAFESALAGDVSPEKTTGTGAVAQRGGVALGIRSSIKKRMEGFKQL